MLKVKLLYFVLILSSYLVLFFLFTPTSALADCTPGDQCGTCTTQTCSNGAACAAGHNYCVWDPNGNYCGGCSEEVNNCASQCSSSTTTTYDCGPAASCTSLGKTGDAGNVICSNSCGSANNSCWTSGVCSDTTACSASNPCPTNLSCPAGCTGTNSCVNGACHSDCTSCPTGGGGGGSTPAPTNPPDCDSNQLTMTVDPDPATQGYNITFSNSSSGSQGSAYIGDSWSGGVNCSGAFWGSKTCLANASGNFSWTHYWGLGADGSTHCSKSINYVINAAPTASITGPTTGTVNTALSYTATAHDSGGKLNKIGIYISPTSSQSWLTPYLESTFTERWDGSYTATWTPTSVGRYYVVTDAYNSLEGKCTGNPFGISYGWSDCGDSDAITVSITSCPAAGTCPSGVCQTTTASVANDSCGTTACPNYYSIPAGTIPACRTSGGSVPDGSCGTTPYTANCATSCSSGLCAPAGTCHVSATTMTTLATDTTTYTATASGGNGTYTYAWTFSNGSTCLVSSCTKSFPTTPGTITASLSISSAGLTSAAISCPNVTVQQAVGPWIQAVGDVHSNTGIHATGGP